MIGDEIRWVVTIKNIIISNRNNDANIIRNISNPSDNKNDENNHRWEFISKSK